MVASSELRDVWLNEIGPKLNARDIIMLSTVCSWSHDIAHNILTHQGPLVRLKNAISACKQATLYWPHLKLELVFQSWLVFDKNNNNEFDDNGLLKCRVQALRLEGTQHGVTNFDFVDGSALETFSFTAEYLSKPEQIVPRNQLGVVLASAANTLHSLTLSCTVV
eukprot:c12502_g1_i1.p1 GENE.c12502_g1_i1~~c12502_g1_i1.p1  ORF type:complete len:165 (+),score=45.65 c12502_g1_i1:143-637(+)